MWHVSSRSGVSTLRTAIHLLLTYCIVSVKPFPLRDAANSEYIGVSRQIACLLAGCRSALIYRRLLCAYIPLAASTAVLCRRSGCVMGFVRRCDTGLTGFTPAQDVATHTTTCSLQSTAVIGAELSMGPFCVTGSNPTHQLTDPTRPNPLQVETVGPNSTQPKKLKISTQPDPTQPMGQLNPRSTLQ